MTSHWDGLQAAYILANRHISEGRDPEDAALDAIWEHLRPAMCVGTTGHYERPRATRKWATRVWRCARCGGQFITQRAYSGYGDSRWVWVPVDEVRA